MKKKDYKKTHTSLMIEQTKENKFRKSTAYCIQINRETAAINSILDLPMLSQFTRGGLEKRIDDLSGRVQ